MNLKEQLANAIRGKVVVMGMGNPSCGDDAAGSCVAQQIGSRPGVYVIDAQDVPESYLGRAADQQPDTVVLIDCVDLKSAPGSVAFFEADQTASYWPSTHRLPVDLLVDYLEKATNARVFLIAIQPRETGFLQPMSREVLSSVEVVAEVLNDVLEMRRTSASRQYVSSLRGRVPA